MPGHGENPIFFNKKDKDWTPSILANATPPTPSLSLIISHFCLTLPISLKVDVIFVSPLMKTFNSIKNYSNEVSCIQIIYSIAFVI